MTIREIEDRDSNLTTTATQGINNNKQVVLKKT